MKNARRLLMVFGIFGAIWFGIREQSVVFAREPEVPEEGTSAVEPVEAESGWLRVFGDLGERGGVVKCSLVYTAPKGKGENGSRILFENLNGGYSSNVGHGAIPLVPGDYTFTLSRYGGGQTSVSGKIQSGEVYSLLAMVDGQRSVLRLVREFPLGEGETPGLVVHNLIAGEPLDLFVSGGEAIRVPYSVAASHFRPATQINGPVAFEYLSRRKKIRRREFEYSGQREVAVFLRNGYGQTTIVTFPAEPETEEP